MTRILSVLLAFALFCFVAFGGMERRLLYPFNPSRVQPPIGIEEIEVQAPDGETLVVWTAPAAPGKPTVLYFHGNAENLALRGQRFLAFTRQGFGVVAPGYRGSSGSTGKPSETAMTADAELLLAEARTRAGDGAVVVYGESMGGAVAIALAERQPPDALLLEAPFSSIKDMAGAIYGVPAVARISRSQWPSTDRIANIRVPLYIVHGDMDEVVPYTQGQAVFEAAGSEDKTFDLVPGIGHANVWTPEVQTRLFDFIDRF